MKVSLSDDALQDLIEAADWLIDAQAWPAVDVLHTEVRQASQRLSHTPGLGMPGPESTRLLPIHRFPYSLVYREDDEGMCVIAVAHQSREPGFWRGRR